MTNKERITILNMILNDHVLMQQLTQEIGCEYKDVVASFVATKIKLIEDDADYEV